ncbi:hypothetical protein AN216_21915 [Streptomyces oceani]|uniref:Uncharacterized protein n=1 Tax=Streptomyces oceani TaxID=1075402 RepID=A0A1E7JWJ6_9ACTN|nr:hypothetical protein AN216_21915 [Streptomyces oceani]
MPDPHRGRPPAPPEPAPEGPEDGQLRLGDGHMRLDPNLTPHQRSLALRIQRTSKGFGVGFVLGLPLTFGGAHYGVTEHPAGFVASALGLALLVVGAVATVKLRALRRQLRQITPDAWRSPVAHLPSARKAARLAAYLNGLLAALSLAAAGYLLVKGAGWGAYGNSIGFGALLTAAFLPLAMATAATLTIPQLLRGVPAGARIGRSLYSILMLLGSMVLFSGVESAAVVPLTAGGTVTAICLAAMTLLGRMAQRMRAESG